MHCAATAVHPAMKPMHGLSHSIWSARGWLDSHTYAQFAAPNEWQSQGHAWRSCPGALHLESSSVADAKISFKHDNVLFKSYFWCLHAPLVLG